MTEPLIDDSTGFDEPAEATPATTKAALAITDDMSRITTAVSEFDRVAAGLAALEAAYPKDVIYEVTTTKGMKAAIEHRAAWRDPRITVEKVRKMAKAPLIALGKNIDARAAWLTEQLLEGEQPIDQQIKAEEARREAEREAKAAAEFGRVLAIQEALAEIAADVAAACGKRSDDISALLERMRTTEPDAEVFQEMLEQARAAWSAGITKLETAHKAKLWEEAEQRRIAAEQEAERIARQKADEERARVAAEQKAEAERLATERAELDRQRAELQAQLDAAAKAQREEAERQARELAVAQARANEAAEREASRQAAEHQAQVEAQMRTLDQMEDAAIVAPLVGIARTATEPLTAPAPEVAAQVGEREAFEEFSADQWWYQELDAICKTNDQRRALAVVRILLRQFGEARDALATQQQSKPDQETAGPEVRGLTDAEILAGSFEVHKTDWQAELIAFKLGARWAERNRAAAWGVKLAESDN
jgi:colicin import membrane protein